MSQAAPTAAAGRRPDGPRGRILTPVLTALAGLVVGIGVGSSHAGTTSATATATVTERPPAVVVTDGPTATVTEVAATSVPAAAGSTIPGDGTFLIPSEVKPGTYRSGAPASGNCYWARMKDATGDTDSIIANGNSSGPSTVTIRAGDKAFQTSGCEDWSRVA